MGLAESHKYVPNGRRRWDFIIDRVKERGYKTLAEVGVVGKPIPGVNSRIILNECGDLEVFFLVDVVSSKVLWELIYDTPAIFMNMPSATAAQFIADESLDLVFIDARHTYDSVFDDISLWLPKVRNGGILGGHDYQPGYFDGLVRAVDEKFPLVNLTDGDHVWWVEVPTSRLLRQGCSRHV